MPYAERAIPQSTNPLQNTIITGRVGNDTSIDAWPIWVASSNATHHAINAQINAAANHAISMGGTATNQVWTIWNTSYTSGTATTINPTIITPTCLTSAQIWGSWNISYTGSNSGNIVRPAPGPARQLTAEELQARAAQDALYREQRIAAQAEEEKAKERAEKLLHESLDGKQREALKANGYFELDVISKNGSSRRYRIHRKWSHSIQQIDPSNGQRLKTLCIHPGVSVPIADSMLAQKLMLESGMEDELLRIANHSF